MAPYAKADAKRAPRASLLRWGKGRGGHGVRSGSENFSTRYSNSTFIKIPTIEVFN